jgi:hypothetical protein
MPEPVVDYNTTLVRVVVALRGLPPQLISSAAHASIYWSDERLLEEQIATGLKPPPKAKPQLSIVE